MDGDVGFNKLYYWLHSADPDTTTVIGGSATPGLSLNELVELSKSPESTQAAFQFNDIKFNLGSAQGNPKLRETIAATYTHELSHLSPAEVIVTNGTTGANHIVHQSFLKPGDHIICQYPIYGPCIEEPEHIGCDISYIHLDPENNWHLDLKQLEALMRPGKTKLIMLNNPVNPTGTHFSTEVQEDLIKLCKKNDVVLHCDEIFHPLFHTSDVPNSFIERHDLDYEKVVVTSSLSKSYGLSGVRIGWIATRSAHLRKAFMSYRVMSCSSVSLIDEAIATEALSPRCRSGILDKHLALARKNISLIQAFVDKHKDSCDWVPPTAGAVGFVRFKDPHTGAAVDDVEFCKQLFESRNVLLAPATLCFEFGELKDAFRGRVRMHFTTTTGNLQKGLQLLDEFLEETEREATNANGHAKL
ncbi:PLP-dependent transferase [Rhizodiscina lignyota]|uniref:PLP-dependent transferase n=1 Tax=Rhizodiscina lignyota TaxID=1504668 RepID=A0A9P4M9S1_9PEZI|nr:PLP-dependent transferase [Rhizodiscina lignyota]